MNRITINVDLNENEILQAEVAEALKGYARRVAREALMEIIDKEAKRVVAAVLSDSSNGLRRELTEQVRNTVRSEISIAGFDHRFVKVEIRKRIDEAAKQVLEQLTEDAKVYLREAVKKRAEKITRAEFGRMVAEKLFSEDEEEQLE